MSSMLPFAGVDRRTAWLRGVLLGACLFGLLLSVPLWSNTRAFPLLPLGGFPALGSGLQTVLFAAMLLSLVLAAWFYRPAVIGFLALSFIAFCEDQNRGQPWLYMYWVLLLLTLLPPNASVAACRWAVTIGYLWSGLQKMQGAFFNMVPAWFVAKFVERWHLPPGVGSFLRGGIACAPYVELFIGIALWVKPLRKAAIAATLVVHLTALLFLGPLGYNYDAVVWPWNVAMIGLVLVLFWPAKSARKIGTPAAGTTQHQTGAPQTAWVWPEPSLASTFAELQKCKPALVIVSLYSFLPLLSFMGMWDSYFSFSLYAENQAKADIFVTQAFRDRLPPAMQKHVHQLRIPYNPQLQGPFVFDFQSWGFDVLKTPPILEPRNYLSLFNYLRQWSKEPTDLRMIMRPRYGPTVFYEEDRHFFLNGAQR